MDKQNNSGPLVIIEGARRSGKSYLIGRQEIFPVFKFDFNGAFSKLDLGHDSRLTHMFGLGKEVMVHQLNKEGIVGNLLIDRGIITNSVWGVMMERCSSEEALNELEYAIEEKYFHNTTFILVRGTYEGNREKDLWDSMEHLIPREVELFDKIFDFVRSRGVKTRIIQNKFNEESVDEFNKLLNELK